MHICLHVSLDGFYVAQFESGRPVAVYQADRVLDADSGARALGIRPGQGMSEAKALGRCSAQFVPYAADVYVEAQRAWLDACLLFSGRIEPESPACAWISLEGHPDPANVAGMILQELGTRFSYRLSAGMAPAKWVAKVAACPLDLSQICLGPVRIEPVFDVAGFLAPLPVELLTPVAAEHRARLSFLGYRRIGDVREAPLSVLLDQFGKDATLIREAAAGRYTDVVVPSYPPLSLEHGERFAGAVENRLAVEQALARLAAALADDLQARDRLAEEVHLLIETEDGQVAAIKRRLPRPTSSPMALQLSLQYLFGKVLLTDEVLAVRVFAPHPRPVGRVQRTLDSALCTKERLRSVELATDKLRAVFGQACVRRAREIELPRREKVLHAWKQTTGWH